jgi:hypothetical protein
LKIPSALSIKIECQGYDCDQWQAFWTRRSTGVLCNKYVICILLERLRHMARCTVL